ncbi:hypothetical protein BJ165DRAFT_1515162 [Panaeolus papilionaceus]|nr:hypothetical protein BJ165DRAFT_1515162 [Panaeolus papilionaceus]
MTMIRSLPTVLILLFFALSLVNGVHALRFAYSREWKDKLLYNPDYFWTNNYLTSLEKKINEQIQDGLFLLNKGLDTKLKSSKRDPRKILRNSLGPFYDSLEVKCTLFPNLIAYLEVLDRGTITIESLFTPLTEKGLFIELTPGFESLRLSEAFFLDKKLPEWLKLYMIMHEAYRMLIPRKMYTEWYAIHKHSGNPDRGTLEGRPLLTGDVPGNDEHVMDTSWTADYTLLIDQSSSAPYSYMFPDVFPVLAYCWDHNGELPPSQAVKAVFKLVKYPRPASSSRKSSSKKYKREYD